MVFDNAVNVRFGSLADTLKNSLERSALEVRTVISIKINHSLYNVFG